MSPEDERLPLRHPSEMANTAGRLIRLPHPTRV
jgi:hypothetical protein